MGTFPSLIKVSYIFSKAKVFLIFWETELSSPKIKKFQEGTFRAQKIKKPNLKKFLIFCEIEHSCRNLKKVFYISGENMQGLENKKKSLFLAVQDD